ncbi:META domain-containing protein [Hymenobacter ruricola]|uniref:META domain-containing protein n=1 Tax=Hymenobacter ruricola TaxID=2791023 RepID=A0ABS0I5Z6_9BACT|nr:META domain-containing protein [Hymenobacter ruricola]MBF9222322.1 META domain-containing protein [Hymenobacter ruricola]
MRASLVLFCLLAASCQTRPAPETATTAPPARTVPDAPLRETRWVLRQLGTQAVSVPANTAEAFLTLRAEGQAEGNGSCNRFRGSFFSEKPGELRFSPLMSTRMACPALDTENGFTRVLAQSSRYRISGDTLRLFDAADAPLARLEAVYLH